MEQGALRELLQDMSLREKVCQLFQVSGAYLEDEGILTGPMNRAGFTAEEISLAGSVLGTIGAAKI